MGIPVPPVRLKNLRRCWANVCLVEKSLNQKLKMMLQLILIAIYELSVTHQRCQRCSCLRIVVEGFVMQGREEESKQ